MFFNKKYIKVNHNEEPEKTQAEEPKQEEAKETAPVVETGLPVKSAKRTG